MGGAVQSFSSPMLAQGMQGGLSGFGTSGLQTFADGGQTTTIQDILAKYKAMESAKPKQDPTTEFLNKSWEGKNIDDYVMYSDKYKRGGKMAKGGIFEHGLQEGDKIVKQVDDKYLIVASKGGVYSVVDIEKGSRFIVGLDDSKTSGKRKSVKAGVKEAMEYINYVKSTKMANGGKFAQGGMLEDAKIYVADLAEYNNGRLVGKWLDLSDYSSGAEVMEAIQEMLDEQTKKDKYGDVHEEYAIHDFEGFPRSFYSESMGESDFDELYEIAKIADSSNLPIDVLMEAVSDLGYEDDPERVAEAYYSSIPASMGNEWRDFAYEYIDSIGNITEAVSKPEYYFDFENFGSDIRMDYTDEELEEMGYNDLSDEELGEQMADEMGGVKNLGEKLIETYFDYDKFGRELEYDFIAVRGKDGDYYFFNRNFAKGGQFKAKNFRKIERINYRGKDENVKEEKWKVLVVPDAFLEEKKLKSAYFNVYAQDEKHAKAFAIYLYSKKYNVPQEHLSIEIAQSYSQLNRFQLKNQYEGKTPQQIWDVMALSQREHFLHDHQNVCEVTEKEIEELIWLNWEELNVSPMKNNVVQAFTEHINEGQYAKGGEFGSIDFSDFSFDTDGDYEDRDVEVEKIKYLRTKIDFDQVRGHIDYRREENNTNLRFFKNGELVMRIKGNGTPNGVNAEISAYGYIGYLNYHPQDGFGGLNMFEFKREVNRVFEDFSQENKQYAKGGKVKNAIDILMTEEPKVWDKFGFNSGSEIRASKDKTKQYAQELEKVLTAKGVKKGSLTKKINEDLTDENYHLLNEFLTRNGYFNSKLTNDLLKSYNNPVYSGAYADKEAITIEEKAKPKTSGAKKIQLKKLSEKTTYVPKREIESIELESGETLSKNDIIDGIYRTKKKFAKGGKIGFEGLAKKVAKRYVGKKVSKEYQAEYGKTYDAKEAKEVGNKVAGKVYKQQVAKKKIVRKLQRKTK